MPLPVFAAAVAHAIHGHAAIAGGTTGTLAAAAAAKKVLLSKSPAARTDELLEKLHGLDERVVSIPDDRVDDAVAAGAYFCTEHRVYKWLTGTMPVPAASSDVGGVSRPASPSAAGA